MADLHRALLIAQSGHDAHQFLQKQISRGEQEIQEDEGLADARQESPRPVNDDARDAACLQLDHG